MRGTLKWVGLALLGLAIAGGVAFAASRLASQQIGIASESISAGDNLAPSVRSAGAAAGSREAERGKATTGGKATPTEAEPAEPVETEPVEPSAEPAPEPSPPPAEHGEGDHHGGGGGGGGGGDD